MGELPEDVERITKITSTSSFNHDGSLGWTSNSLQSLLDTKLSKSQAATTQTSKFNNLVSFLAIAQHYEIDIAPYVYESDTLLAGTGGTSLIRQRHLQQQEGLVFKVVHIRDALGMEDEEATYNALISEISILGHPALRHHPAIIGIECVGFDVGQDSDQVRPFLILEKAQHGNLEQFVQTEQGRCTTWIERMNFCIQITSAVLALHDYDFIHGDIKPQNVVVFTDKDGHCHPKLTDFGYANRSSSDQLDSVIRLPKSIPWNAPEHHHRGFTVQQAKATDFYSLGLLCFWLLFHDWPLCDSTLELLDIGKSDFREIGQLLKDTVLMEKLKANGLTRKLACHLAQESSSVNLRSAELVNFFAAILSSSPEARQSSIFHLDPSLNTKLVTLPDHQLHMPLQLGNVLAEFKIGLSLYSMYQCHIWVRQKIASVLEDIATSLIGDSIEQNAAFQLAICYCIGFGRTTDTSFVDCWLQLASKTHEHLHAEISQIAASFTSPKGFLYRNKHLNEIRLEDLQMQDLVARKYSKDLDNYLPVLATEIRDLERNFGITSEPVFILQIKLIQTLSLGGRIKDAESLVLSLIQRIGDYKNDSSIPSWQKLQDVGVLENTICLPGSPPLQLQLPEIGSLQPALESLVTLASRGTSNSITLLAYLAMIYDDQHRYKEAVWLFIWWYGYNTKRNSSRRFNVAKADILCVLSISYFQMGELAEAEKILMYTIAAIDNHLGSNHPMALDHLEALAHLQIQQNKFDEAESLVNQVFRRQEKFFSPDSSALHETRLAFTRTYWNQHRPEEAERLLEQSYNARKFLPRSVINPTLKGMWYLVSNHIGNKNLDRAEMLCIKALVICVDFHPVEPELHLQLQIQLSIVRLCQRRLQAAKKTITTTVELLQSVAGRVPFDMYGKVASLLRTWATMSHRHALEDQARALGISVPYPGT